jgi:hypothetical protein
VRQVVYVSLSSIPGDGADLAGILNQSRHNNAIDGVTGLLWSDGRCFLQVLEGTDDGIAACLLRIRNDSRHHSIKILFDRQIDFHEFGGWNMIHRRANERTDMHDAQMARLIASSSEGVRAQFMKLISSNPGEPSKIALGG